MPTPAPELPAAPRRRWSLGGRRVVDLPLADPGTPDLRGPWWFLLRAGRLQWRPLAWGSLLGVVWMASGALMPAAVGRAVDRGLVEGGGEELVRWSLALVVLALVQAASGVLRHRAAVTNWLVAYYRTTQWVGRHVTATGTAVPAAVPTGEVVSTVGSDADRLGAAFDVVPRLVGAVVASALVAVLLLRTSTALGLVVLVGVPALTAVLALVVRPLQSRQKEQRDLSGRLTTLGADTVAGLRVLRGVGGEDVFAARYVARSQEVRRAGVRVAGVQAVLEGLQVLLPGALTALVLWLGARAAVRGTISTGELVAFYGYAAFLVLPLRTAVEALEKVMRAVVGSRKVLAVLRVEPSRVDPAAPAAPPTEGAALVDPASGAVVEAGRLTAVVSAVPEDASALCDRLARATDETAATWGGVRLVDLPVAWLRERVVLSETDPHLFTGGLREALDPHGRHDDAALLDALDVASGADLLEALPDGLDSDVEERGRSFSGGQRQRLALARALLAEPDVLLLVEPTSAVDAHTEARIAERLRSARAGRTTAVATASPLLLERADDVVLLEGGRAVARGTHRDLLADPRYRAVVLRGDAETAGAGRGEGVTA